MLLITNNESNVSRRIIPVSAISSNGTSPSTTESGGQPQWMMGGVYKGNTTNTLSVVSAGRGEYFVSLTQSEVSVVGQGCVYYSSGSCLEWSTPFQVVAYDSGDSAGLGLSGVTVGNIVAKTYSGVTVGSAATILAGTYSGVTLGVNSIAAGTYSGVTVGSLATIPAGDYSSSVTFGAGTIKAATYSGVTVGVNNVAAGTYSGVTTSGFDSGGNQAVANSLLSTNVGNSRLVQEYLWPMRNKVQIAGSVMTVFKPDDLTSSWTASLTTGTITITTMDPQG